jgi:hypothetical protein
MINLGTKKQCMPLLNDHTAIRKFSINRYKNVTAL